MVNAEDRARRHVDSLPLRFRPCIALGRIRNEGRKEGKDKNRPGDSAGERDYPGEWDTARVAELESCENFF